MWKATRTGLLLSLVGCYLEPDTHRTTDEATANEAGVMSDVDAAGGETEPPRESGTARAIDGESTTSPDSIMELTDASDADGALGPEDAAMMAALDAGCLGPDWCSAARPVCHAGECGACAAHAECTRYPGTPACGPAGACVECAAESKTLCTGATPACDPTTNRCAECVADSDCPTAQKAACGADRHCGACKEDADCTRFSKVCDTKSGACVQCRPQTEEADCRTDPACDARSADCAGTACDPKLLVCTSKPRLSVAICGACVSDSECIKDHRCIPMTFGAGAARRELGGFCLKTASTGCTEPFRAPAISRVSLSGAAAANYCGISETVTSCPAIESNRAARKCSDATACGPGGRCEPVNFGDKVCTYSCASPLFCPVAYPCAGPAGSEYCGGPS